jgi:hypothetical protein
MKKLFALTLCALALRGNAQSYLISQFTNLPSPPSSYLFLMEEPGVQYYNMSLLQLTAYLNSNLTISYAANAGNANGALLALSALAANTSLFANEALHSTNSDNAVNASNATNANFAVVATNALDGNLILSANQETNIFSLRFSTAYTNGGIIFLTGTNYNIANSNYIWIAVTNSAQGKLFVSSNGVWFAK